MNKISKKIVSLITMAAFVLTLVPAAAFAEPTADPDNFSVEASQVKVVTPNGQTEGEVSIAAKSDLTVHFDLKNKDGSNHAESKAVVNFYGLGGNGGTANGNTLQVWAVNNDTEKVTDALVIKGIDTDGNGQVNTNPAATGGDFDVVVSFTRAGNYTIYAGLGTSQQDAEKYQFTGNKKINTVVVAPEETTVDTITLAPASIEAKADSFTPHKVTATVSGVIADTTTSANNFDGKVISIENDNENKGVYVYKTGTETTTNQATVSDDKASFDVVIANGAVPGKYPIVLSCDKGETTLYVTVQGNDAATSIEVVDADSQYVNMEAPNFNGVAEVIFKDADGNATTMPTINKTFVSAPEGFNKADNNSKLSLEPVINTNKYVLKYNGTNLKAGKYTVRLGIAGQTATSAIAEVSFTAVKVGDTVALEIDMDNDAETIVSGDYVTGTVYAVDANGIKTAADDADVVLGFANSAAVDLTQTGANYTDVTLSGSAAMAGKFRVKAKSDEKYYGSKITLIAFDENAKVQATKELTVVDGMTTNTLAFDKEAGSVAKNNTVKVSVVDENGKAVAANGQAYAYVESQSNEDAKVDVSFAKGNSVTDGKIDMTVYSDKETTADIVVAVKDSETNAIYANTLKYTFGEQDIPVGTSVVMTIGSNDFVVNNDVVSVKDAAPYVANDRTYVPFRALGEALGAEVVWDNDARTVTYTLGKTEVVMTIGEKTYTVNGEEKTMDVAPEITNDRTYVPVRFVGEALGFKVTALSAADGTTASVVFQK